MSKNNTNILSEIQIQMIEFFIDELKSNLKSYDLGNSELYDKITYEITDDRIDIIMPDYYIYVEEGRAPGSFPPVDAIIQWMKKKGITSSKINSVAFAIAKKIEMEGIKARPFLNDTITSIDKGILNEIEKSISDYLDKQIEDITNG